MQRTLRYERDAKLLLLSGRRPGRPTAVSLDLVRKVMLLDGNSLTYRAFFALPTDMATASGQVTNAVYGFTAMLIYLLKEHQPDGVIVAFDRPEPTFRHVQIPTYKAQRDEAPDILRQQMGLVREVIAALGIQMLELAGWEADDIIATLVEMTKAKGDEAIIVTGDRDSYQLVLDPWVKVLYNRRGVSDYALYDEAGIKEKTGVTPAQYPEYAALRGDPSDNLPGVPGVGEKTAAKLINTYGGLDGIFANADAQTPKLRESLKEHEARARENASVMVLRRDAPIEVDLDDTRGEARSGRGEAVVRVPRVPLAHRPPPRGPRVDGRRGAGDGERPGARSRDHPGRHGRRGRRRAAHASDARPRRGVGRRGRPQCAPRVRGRGRGRGGRSHLGTGRAAPRTRHTRRAHRWPPVARPQRQGVELVQAGGMRHLQR